MRRLPGRLHHLSARDAAGRWQPGGLASAKSGHGPNYSGTANSPSSDQSSCGIVTLMMRGVATRCCGKVC